MEPAELFSVGPPSHVPMGVVKPNTWTEPPASEWMVRGPEYLHQSGTNVLSLKQKSSESPYACVGLNVFRSTSPLLHSANRVLKVKHFLDSEPADEEDGMPRFLVICWMFQNFFGTEFVVVQHLFKLTAKPSGEDGHLDAAVKRFMAADDAGKNTQLKYMFKVVEGPGVMKTAVATLGGERPVIIGKKLTTKYFQGKNYLEIDMDVGSSMTASMLHSTMMQTAGGAILDESWLFEAQKEEELPERVLAKVRWNYCDPSTVYVDVDDAGDIITKPQ